ncbi:hypothetical protein GE115_10465 [Agromyces sp. CFH 90414]|uniref:Uncharacterized protein n=2 Tax=Agromyces agglutinans TaxID=2662258 RepID=A0A6I2FCS5_9MICO|nr:hypothetical protein [Agromyces agglutinans]
MREIPAWAVLERRLFDEIETAWRAFSARYCEPDGRIRFAAGFDSRDGVDDLYEPFFNWPAFHALGGSDDILDQAKHHWTGVTAQLTEAGMLTDEYENGYDWFHQGESLLFFYGLCAADPGDTAFADRARRFAELYTDPANGNYDPARNVIRAPHNGALGPLPGLGPEWQAYSAGQGEMRAYGLPLEHLPGIERWEDLEDPANADAMGQAMQRLAAGDVPVNLAATSLVANRWLYDGDAGSAEWILRYVDGWRDRAAANGGLLPDNVAPDGTVGGLHEGRWYGGHYGWNWPHGLHSVGMSTLIGELNASFVSGDAGALDLTRTMLDTVLEHAITASVEETPFSLRGGALARFGADASKPALLVPYRHGRDGWFDYGPMPLELPTWLWWWSRDPADRARLRRVIDGLPATDEPVKAFRDKAEAGHEAPWIAFLDGELPDYPVRALSMALGQVARRLAVMDAEPVDPANVHLHFWQRANPVVTEVLGQLVTGTPQVLYNGGLPFTAVAYEDADRDRPGLPPDVAALVTRLDGDRIELELVNLSGSHARRLRVRPSRFAQQRLVAVESHGERDGAYPGRSTAYASTPGTAFTETVQLDAADVLVELPPSHRAVLTLMTAPADGRPHHVGAPATARIPIGAVG